MRRLPAWQQVQHADDHSAERQPEHARSRGVYQPFPCASTGQAARDAIGEIVESVANPADMEFVEAMEENLPADPQHRSGADRRERAEQPGHEGNEPPPDRLPRSEEHTSELQSLMRISYAVFCLKQK